MRIRRVRAIAFGPLRDQTLELAEGMTVITGPNESGKSSWHAAIDAAVCGMRRAKGRRTAEDAEFARRHRPWDGDEWCVEAIVELPDGRTVELHQDLDGLVDCRALDAVTGADLTREILHEGTPDGSRWLGLTRRTFRSVACVRQAQILRVLDDATALQDDLQRAAATAGADQTAARALELIDAFRTEHVGSDRRNATKPLRRAMDQLDAATGHEAEVRRLHQQWQSELEQLAHQRDAAHRYHQQLALAEAARAVDAARRAEGQLERIRDLAARHPLPPPEPVDPELPATVARALAAWEQRPRPSLPDGDDAATLRARLEALGAAGAGPRSTGPSGAQAATVAAAVLVVASVVAAATGRVALAAGLVVAAAATAFGAHQARSRQRAEQARRVSDYDDLARRLRNREQQEARAREDEHRVREATEALRAAARRVGLPGDQLHAAPEVLAASLDAWLQQLKRTEERSAVARREWADLQALLAGRPLPDVEGHVAELRRRADDLRQQVDPTQLAAWRWDGAPDDVVAALGREAARLDAEVAGLEGSLRARTGGVPSVAEAVEEVAAARAELERVTTLRDDLATAESFLRQAEQRANRDLAPRLAGAVRDRLGPVTAGRYTDVRVDPATMEVTVLDPDGRWRAARDLSHGTAEQIYLLLRVALAELLVQPGASCPLLLDDVLVQSDPTRSRAVLDLLLRVSSDHQVILFSQEDDVQRWARTHLAGQSRHRHVELPPAPTGRPPRSGSVADPEAAAVTPFP